MPDFQRVAAPIFTPTRCQSCSTHRDSKGFIDTLVETLEGHVYHCVTCVEQMGLKVGMLSEEQAVELTRLLQNALAEASALKNELETERENKVISLKDARALSTEWIKDSLKAGEALKAKA